MSELYGLDAYTPSEIAKRIETVGVAKANMATLPLVMLGLLAGAFIGLGALFFTLVKSDPTLGFAASAVLGGLVFSLGLVLVVVAGAELFTGNNLLAMAWADPQPPGAAQLAAGVSGQFCRCCRAGGAGICQRAHRDERWWDWPAGAENRPGQAKPVLGAGFFPRRVVQCAGVHGCVDGDGRAQRDRQNPGHCVSNHRIRGGGV
jgi:hypothetical protein